MSANPLDAIQARADLAQGAWEEFNLGIATTRFALDEANNSAEDVPRLLAALRAVEAVMDGWQYDELIEPADDLKEAIAEALG